MKFTPLEIQALLKASYEKPLVDVGKFIIDPFTSSTRVKTYTIPDSTDVIVVHRGSDSKLDWFDNSTYLTFNVLKSSKTYRMHKNRHLKATKKYGKENVIVLGHSRGALYADALYKEGLAKQVVTYNKPVNTYDVAKDIITPKEEDENETNIRTSNDIVSIGQNLTKSGKNDIVIEADTLNPVESHGTDKLINIGDQLIGKGLTPNYSKLRLPELRAFIKQHRKNYESKINVTGKRKAELISIINDMLGKMEE